MEKFWFCKEELGIKLNTFEENFSIYEIGIKCIPYSVSCILCITQCYTNPSPVAV